jgi:hypothetical protein
MPLFSSQRSVNGVFSARKKSSGVIPFLTRQVITTGYVAAGYKDGVAWRNVNVLSHTTDTCTNLGDLLQEAANYTKGAQTKNTAYVFATNGTGTQGVGAFTSTSCFNMRNNTTMTKNNSMNSGTAIADGATIQSTGPTGEYLFAYHNGNNTGTFTQKFNMTTEVYVGTISSSMTQGTAGSHWGENHGYWWTDDGTGRKLVWATESETTPATSPGNHGQQKGLSAKTGFGYGGNEGNYGSGRYFRKWNYTTEVTVSTPQKPVWWGGEENFNTGQTAGYMLGHYNDTAGGNASGGGQTNDSGKFTYATDTGVRGAFDPTGTQSGTGSAAGSPIGGRSSGVGFWRD